MRNRALAGGEKPKGAPPQGNAPGGGFGEVDNSSTIAYLTAHRNGAKFLLVTFGAQSAASYTTATGENILPVGGFDGQDPTPTLTQFKKMVSAGEIRYVLVGGNSQGGNVETQGNSKISTWVSTHCSLDANAPTSNLYFCSKN